MLPAEQYVSERGQRAIGTIRYSGPEQIVDRMGARAGRQAGHFAIAKVPDYAKPVIQVPCGRSAKTLAVCPPRVEPDVLIPAEYLGLRVILSPDWGPKNDYKCSKNQQFTHLSSCNEALLGLLQSSWDTSPASSISCPLFPPEQHGGLFGEPSARPLFRLFESGFEFWRTRGKLDGAPAAVPKQAFLSC